MSSRIITLTTDFGEQGGYVAQMKAVILGINPDARLIDICHLVPPQDIATAAWLVRDVIDAFPRDAIHIAVVDPGVGSARRIVAGQWDAGCFVAPDNGILTLIDQEFARVSLVYLDRGEYWRSPCSNTFHGRDIMAPVAAHLSLGVGLEQVGTPASQLVHLDLPRPRMEGNTLVATVIRVDSFGNLITNVRREDLERRGWNLEQLRCECQGQEARGLQTHYAGSERGELVALCGSSGRLEMAVVQGDAARRLGAAEGGLVRIRHGDAQESTAGPTALPQTGG